MQVNNVSSINMKGHGSGGSAINAGNTGVVAAVGLTAAALTSLSKNNTLRKSHKIFGLIAVAAMLAHIWLVTAWKRK